MKFTLAIITLALASQCLSAPAPNDEYADLINETLLYFKQLFTEHETVNVPDIDGLTIKNDNVDLVVSQTNNYASLPQQFTIQQVSTDPSTKSAKVSIQIPQIIQGGNYQVQGTALGKKVSGSGTIKVQQTSFTQSVAATFVNPDTSVQISSLNLDYTVGDVDIDITGLTIEGMSADDVTLFIKQVVPEYIKTQTGEISKMVAPLIQAQLNSQTSGKTIQEVIAWLKSQIHA